MDGSEGEVLAVQFLGASQRLEVKVGSQTLSALQVQSEAADTLATGIQPGQRVALQWATRHMVMLDA